MLKPVSIRGNVYEQGSEIELDPIRAKDFGDSVELASKVSKEVKEKTLEELTKAELVAMCDQRGLETKGNKSDLIARIEESEAKEDDENIEDDEDIVG